MSLMGVPGLGQLGWVADHQAPDGVWVDASGVAFDGTTHGGGGSAPSPSTFLAVPGQVTGAFGLTPLQALNLGLQTSGVTKAPAPVVPVAQPAAGIGLGTGLVLGGLAIGGIYLATRKKKPEAAASV